MGELPEIWRTELWHPMVVHFPIVLLLGAAVLRIISLFFEEEKQRFLINAGRLSLYVGVATAWMAVYTGTLADAIVVRELCDPTVLESHENSAYTLGYIFTSAAVLDIISILISRKYPGLIKKTFSEGIIIVLLIAGTASLGYTAHLGASLVYQQGAGVYQPTADCTEFE